MRTIKIILLLTTISFFTSVSASAEAKDCSIYKGNTQRFICEKLGGISSGNATTSDKSKKKGNRSNIIPILSKHGKKILNANELIKERDIARKKSKLDDAIRHRKNL